ncbi:MAG: outer membrane beta-barrel protein [Oligosphaeraceae bacterium]
MKKHLLLILSLLASLSLFAQEEAGEPAAPTFQQGEAEADWTVSVGVAYRNFHSPHVKSGHSPSMTNFVLDESTGTYRETTNENLQKAWNARYPGLGDGVNRLSFASFPGAYGKGRGDYGVREQTAPALSFAKGLWSQDNLDLQLVANFQYYSMGTQDGGSVTGAFANSYDRYVSNVGNVFTPSDVILDSTSAADLLLNSRVKFDMDLYVVDLGVSLGYNLDNGIRAFVAAGPTLSVADMETTSYAGITTGENRMQSRDRANETEFNWGLYASAGAGYWFNETIGLSAELRYDKGLGDVGTRYVRQSLNTFGGMMKLQMRF